MSENVPLQIEVVIAFIQKYHTGGSISSDVLGSKCYCDRQKREALVSGAFLEDETPNIFIVTRKTLDYKLREDLPELVYCGQAIRNWGPNFSLI